MMVTFITKHVKIVQHVLVKAIHWCAAAAVRNKRHVARKRATDIPIKKKKKKKKTKKNKK